MFAGGATVPDCPSGHKISIELASEFHRQKILIDYRKVATVLIKKITTLEN